MNIHNTTEDFVWKYLDEILESKSNVCKCEQCKKDMVCYTLNRVKPMYVISSRGIIHTENEKRYSFQETIDIYTTLSEATEVVSSTRRHEVKGKAEYKIDSSRQDTSHDSNTSCFFNFPQMVGRIIDSSTLLPILDAKVTLYDEKGEEIIPMFNINWQNPLQMVPQMEGTFSLWPAPLPADKIGLQEDFNMSLHVEKEGYEFTRKFFFVRVVSSNELRNFINKENLYYIEDIFINKGKRKGGR